MSDVHGAGLAFVDGRIVPVDEARIPLTETGFTKSDATYDVVSVWNGKFFRLADHLDRFERSCRSKRFALGYRRDDIERILMSIVSESALREAYVAMIATRGVPQGGQRDPRVLANRFYAYAVPYIWIVEPEQQAQGVSLHVSGIERISPRSIDPTVKNFHWGDLVAGQLEAHERGSTTVVLVDQLGNLTEGPGYNVFALIEGDLRTPAHGILEGITRRTVIELAHSEQIAVAEVDIPAADLVHAQEVFLTTTAGGLIPVVDVDGCKVGTGVPGPLTTKLKELYWAAHDSPQFTTPVTYTRVE